MELLNYKYFSEVSSLTEERNHLTKYLSKIFPFPFASESTLTLFITNKSNRGQRFLLASTSISFHTYGNIMESRHNRNKYIF